MDRQATLCGLAALVTGGGSGIGLACAAALSGAGAAVTVLGRRDAPLRSAVAAGHAQALIVADLTDAAALASALHAAPAYALLVNAAGGAESAPFAATDDAMWQRMLGLNLLGAVAITRLVLPGMLAAGFGRVVHIASTAALKGYPYVTAYTAAKHGLLGLTRGLAAEHAKSGVTFNAVCPGFTDTELVARSVATITQRTGRDTATARAALARHNPQGRLVTPQEVAAAVLALCSRDGGAISGQAIAVDGGETA